MSTTSLTVFLGIFLGIIAYVMLYIGKGLQKLAITGIQKQKALKKKDSGIWIFGTTLTALFVFVQWIPLALLHTPIKLIAPLEGIGLVSLLFFSYYKLHEKISVYEFISSIFIIIGTILINIVVSIPVKLTVEDFQLDMLCWIFGIFLVTASVSFFFARTYASNKTQGIVLGLSAGSFMAFQTLSKRLTDINELRIIFVVLTLFFALMTLPTTQWALSKANANIVIPSFASTSIVLTLILGSVVINEEIAVIQIIGTMLILTGIILMNLGSSCSEMPIESISPDI